MISKHFVFNQDRIRKKRSSLIRICGALIPAQIASGIDQELDAMSNEKSQAVTGDVREFGAIGDGNTDDTKAIQRAVDQCDDVYFPRGTYLVEGRFGVICNKVHQRLLGDHSHQTILKQGKHANRVFTLFPNSSVNSGLRGKPAGVSIESIKFVGQAVKLGFSEFVPIIYAAGVSNLVLRSCMLIGFRGDGIYLGMDEKRQDRSNSDIEITDCLFDGVNKQNRNAISIIDGANILIDRCTFRNCSRGDMPGSIDLEQNESSRHRIRNITVSNCQFFDDSGGVGHVCVVVRNGIKGLYPQKLSIEHNKFFAGNAFAFINLGPNTQHNFEIRVANNEMIGVRIPIRLLGSANGIEITNNKITHSSPISFGKLPTSDLRNLTFSFNKVTALYPDAVMDVATIQSGELTNNSFTSYLSVGGLLKSGSRDLDISDNSFY